jgi:hypothetical protein
MAILTVQELGLDAATVSAAGAAHVCDLTSCPLEEARTIVVLAASLPAAPPPGAPPPGAPPPGAPPSRGMEQEELRIDSSDGQAYSLSSFLEVYGGTAEWDRAKLGAKPSLGVRPQTAPAIVAAAAGGGGAAEAAEAAEETAILAALKEAALAGEAAGAAGVAGAAGAAGAGAEVGVAEAAGDVELRAFMQRLRLSEQATPNPNPNPNTSHRGLS